MKTLDLTILLSHTDMDGYASQWLNDKRLQFLDIEPGKVILLNCDYGKILSSIEPILKEAEAKGKKVGLFITDLNLNDEEASVLDNYYRNRTIDVIELLDHHVSGLEVSKKYNWYKLDTSCSATKIVWKFLVNNLVHIGKDSTILDHLKAYNDVVKLINAADVFDKSDMLVFRKGRILTNAARLFTNISKNVEGLYPKLSYEERHLEVLRDLTHEFLDTLLQKHIPDQDGKSLFPSDLKVLEFELRLNRLAAEVTMEYFINMEDGMDFSDLSPSEFMSLIQAKKVVQSPDAITISLPEGKQMLVMPEFNLPVSDISNNIFEYYTEWDAVCFQLKNNIWSFRSKDKGVESVDVSKLCSALGGGGHKHAAGVTKVCTVNEMIELITEHFNSTVA